MGNATSKKDLKKGLERDFSSDLLFRKINKISSDLILNSNNDDLLQFMDPEYCNKIINITANILNENFTKNQIKIINNKIKKNKKKSVESFIENLKSINDSIYDENISNKKKKICEQIATYYVKIVHIFSAIKNVIDEDNPICNKTKKFKYDKDEKKKEFDITVSADICNKKGGSPEIKKIRTLSDENGIPELENLYKDKYIPETERFVMSEKQKKLYDSDVSKFYKSYTGNDKPEEIKRFSDIPILKYKSVEICKKMNEKSRSKLKGNSKNDNLINFASHIANIMNNSRKFDKNLIKILDYLFIPDKDGIDYIINENLSFEDIDNIIEKVRKIIMELYIICDKDYRKGIKLFENILLDKNIELAKLRLKNPDKTSYNNYNEKFKKNPYNNYAENYQEKKLNMDNKIRDENNEKMNKEIKKELLEQKKKLEEDNKQLIENEEEEEERRKYENNKDKQINEVLADIRGKDIKKDIKAFDIYDLSPTAADVITDAMDTKFQDIFDNHLKKCPKNHDLEYLKRKYIVECDICYEDINAGENCYHCKLCDFDICDKNHDPKEVSEAYLVFLREDEMEDKVNIKNSKNENTKSVNNENTKSVNNYNLNKLNKIK